MYNFEINKKVDRIEINLKGFLIGQDLCIIIYGGDKLHIGATTLSIPRKSLSNCNKFSSSTSVLTLLGHKDDEIAREVSHTLASRLNKNTVVICGIHLDDISNEEIAIIIKTLEEITELAINKISKFDK